MKTKIRPSIRRKRLLYKLALILIIITPLIVFGSVKQVDKSCRLDYPNLSTLEAQTIQEEPIEKTIPTYDIPLSAELQEYTYEKSIKYDVDHVMVLAIMQVESHYKPDVISQNGDYGLMQINQSNHKYLEKSINTTDFLDPEQNIEAGIVWLSGIYANNHDPNKILMVYNMSGNVAQELWERGIESTAYSREVLKGMDEIRERQVEV